MKPVILLCLLTTLAGCGGGDGDGSNNLEGKAPIGDGSNPSGMTDMEGIWRGVHADVWTGTRTEVIALVSAEGEFRVIGEGRLPQLIGSLNQNAGLGGAANYYSATGNVGLEVSLFQLGANLTGSVAAQKQMRLTVVYPDQSYSSLALEYDSSYEQPASLSAVQGTFVNAQMSMTVNGNQLFGQDSFGCTYSGNVSVPEKDKNLYELQITLSNCANLNGAYSGLATLVNSDELIFQINSGYYAMNGTLVK